MESESKFEFSPRKCPCKDCDEHAPGCHTIQCPHGWYQWNEYMNKRREEINAEKERIAEYYRYRKEALRKMQDRGSSIRQAKKTKGIKP